MINGDRSLGWLNRLNTEGSIDQTFVAPEIVGTSKMLGVYPDGGILYGDIDSSGYLQMTIKRALPDGSPDPEFTEVVINHDGAEATLLADGRIYLRGYFTAVDGEPVQNLLRLNADGTVDEGFSSPLTTFQWVGLVPIGEGGTCFLLGAAGLGEGLGELARLDENGSVDQTFNTGDFEYSSIITRAFPQSDGSVVADIGGDLRRFTASGALDSSFTSNLVGKPARYGSPLRSGKIYYLTRRYIDNVYSDELRRMNPDFTDDESFTAITTPYGQNYGVGLPIVLDDDSLILGALTAERKSARIELSRVLSDGSVDPDFGPRFSRMQPVSALVLMPDGRHAIVGRFDYVDNVAVPQSLDLVRLEADGSLDPSFTVVLPEDSYVMLLRPQSGGKLLAFGSFPMANGTTATVLRFNTDGTLDESFGFIGDNLISPVIDPSGRIYATMVGETSGLRRFLPNGEMDQGFDAGSELTPDFIHPLPGGGVLVGRYIEFGAYRFQRLKDTGSVDDSEPELKLGIPVLTVGLPDGGIMVVTTSQGRSGRFWILRRVRLDGVVDFEYTTRSSYNTPAELDIQLSMIGVLWDLLREASGDEPSMVWADFSRAGGVQIQASSDGRIARVYDSPYGGELSLYTRSEMAAPSFDASPAIVTTSSLSSDMFPIGYRFSPVVISAGLAPFTYQWYRNGEPIADEEGQRLSFTVTSSEDAGTYHVVVTNELGSVTSEPFELTVDSFHESVSVSTHLVDQATQIGGTVSFSVETRGNPAPTFQWYLNGTLLPNATSATLTVENVDQDDLGEYRVRVQNRVVNEGGSFVWPAQSFASLRLNQTITFTGPGGWERSDSPVKLGAMASSGLPVTFEVVSGPATVSGDMLTLTGIGPVIVRAVQAGNETFAANAVERTFAINWGTSGPTKAIFDNLDVVHLTGGRLIAWQQTSSPPSSISTGFRGAMPFTVGDKDYVLRSIALHLKVDNAVPNLRIKLCEDDGGLPAEVPMEIISLNPALPLGAAVHTFASATTPVLRANTPYWVVLEPATFDTETTSNDVAYTWFDTVSGTANVPGAYWWFPGPDWEAWQSYPGSPGLTLRVDAVEVVPPTILEQPRMQRVTLGGSATFSVRATGASGLLFQWTKAGVAIPGATEPTLVIHNATSADAGSYRIEIRDHRGIVESEAVSLGFLPSDVSATQMVNRMHYQAGGTVAVTNTFTHDGSVSALSWQVLLPDGWRFASSEGDETAAEKPTEGMTDLAEWRWSDSPTSPIEFNYVLNVPTSSHGETSVVALVTMNPGSEEMMLLARPDPLYLIDKHRGDVDGDGRLSLSELLRVIELYNTRNGTVRTGTYGASAGEGTPDSFRAEPGRSSGADLTMSRYHSADSNRDGMLSLSELLRVIELYNTRDGTVRTGAYHLQVDSVDGFASGPE